MNETDIVAMEIESLRKENTLFAAETVLFEKNDNSSIAQKLLPCNKEFFDRLFNASFWELYSELGLASMPFGCRYMHFFGNEMFFCRNAEERFLKNIGLEKKFFFSQGKILQKTKISASNLVFLAAAPFEMAKNASNISIAAFKINSELLSFEGHYNNSLSFWKRNRVVDNTVAVSLQAMAGALRSMRYSLISSLAYSLKIKLRRCFATKRNLLKELSLLPLVSKEDELVDRAGFFSLSPYDISKPFLEENPFFSDYLKKMPAPSEQHYILRENAKLCCSMYLSVLRKCFLKVAELKEIGKGIFFLKPAELQLAFSDYREAEGLCRKRKMEFEQTKEVILPSRIAVERNNFFFETIAEEREIHGKSAGARAIAEGRLVFVEGAKDSGKVLDGDIIFSRTFSPELVVLYGKGIGIISTSGGMLAHCAIVAREKGLPCIVQLKGSQLLKEGAQVRIDGNTGKIKRL